MFGLLQEVAGDGGVGGSAPVSIKADQYLGFVGIPKPPVRTELGWREQEEGSVGVALCCSGGEGGQEQEGLDRELEYF
eukprot:1724275-Rhodomonas_salina.3